MNIFYLLLLITVSACSTLKKEDCEKMDWQARGFSDGEDGEEPETFDDYTEQCKEFGINTDKERYLKGLKAGLKNFCTFDNGYHAGLSGAREADHCDDIDSSYRNGFEKGEDQKELDEQRKKHEEETERLRKMNIPEECCYHRGADGSCYHEKPGCF